MEILPWYLKQILSVVGFLSKNIPSLVVSKISYFLEYKGPPAVHSLPVLSRFSNSSNFDFPHLFRS